MRERPTDLAERHVLDALTDWDLRAVVEFVDLFRAPHRRTPDTEQACPYLRDTLIRLTD